MNQRHAHPRANFPEALAAANLGNHLTALAREKLQYLASMEDNSVDIAMFTFALEAMLDETPNARAVLAQHRARYAREQAHKQTFGLE